jgi:hypothetical protein
MNNVFRGFEQKFTDVKYIPVQEGKIRIQVNGKFGSATASSTTEPNPLVARYEENTKEKRSILRPSILRLFFGSVSHLAKGKRKYRVDTYFERVEGPPFLFVSPFYLCIYIAT